MVEMHIQEPKGMLLLLTCVAILVVQHGKTGWMALIPGYGRHLYERQLVDVGSS